MNQQRSEKTDDMFERLHIVFLNMTLFPTLVLKGLLITCTMTGMVAIVTIVFLSDESSASLSNYLSCLLMLPPMLDYIHVYVHCVPSKV